MLPYYLAYYTTLLTFFVFSFFPLGRLWGFGHWAYLPLTLRLGLLGAGVLAPPVIHWLTKRDEQPCARTDRKYLILAAVIGVTLIVLFYFLRARTFFHGDGYALISLIATENVSAMKLRNLGSSALHIWLFDVCGGGTEREATQLFQAVSIIAGVLLLWLIAYLFSKLFASRRLNALAFTGVVSSGFMLLYFGYVEYYALFDLAVVCYVLTGLLIVRRLAPKWSIVVLQGLAVLFHI